MLKSTIVLTLVCLIAAALLGFAYVLTEEQIANQDTITLNDNLKEVLPSADSFEEQGDMFIAKKDGKIIGYAKIAESQGYSSVIKILVGMDKEQKITSIRILDQLETPGLGDNAKKPEFYSQFDGLTKDQIALKKKGGEIDAITGATITSEAVIKGVRESLENG